MARITVRKEENKKRGGKERNREKAVEVESATTKSLIKFTPQKLFGAPKYAKHCPRGAICYTKQTAAYARECV